MRIRRFGVYELDPAAGELRRGGRRVHLAPQAMTVLTLLVDRAGELVTRDEIREALWGGETFVDFDTAINACISQIRSALRDESVGARFIETVPRRGYRFIAPITEANRLRQGFGGQEASPHEFASDHAASQAPGAARRSAFKAKQAPLVATFVVAAAVLGAWFLAGRTTGTAAVPTLAILPIEGDAQTQALADRLQEQALVDLQKRAGAQAAVLAKPAVAALRGDDRSAERLRATGAAFFLDASLRATDGGVRLHAKVARLTDLRILWSDDFDISHESIRKYAATFARDLSQRLLRGAEMSRQLSAALPHDGEAFDLVLSARLALDEHNARESAAIERLEEALRLSPGNALAHALLARALARTAIDAENPETFDRARRQAEAALRLDPSSADAHAALGAVYLFGRVDLKRAEAELRQAMSPPPRSPAPSEDARRWYSAYLSAVGRHDAAIQEAIAARDAAPAGLASLIVARACHAAGRQSCALEAAEEAIALHPESDAARRHLQQAAQMRAQATAGQ